MDSEMLLERGSVAEDLSARLKMANESSLLVCTLLALRFRSSTESVDWPSQSVSTAARSGPSLQLAKASSSPLSLAQQLTSAQMP